MKWGARFGDFWGSNQKIVEVSAIRSSFNPAEINVACAVAENDAKLHVHIDGYKRFVFQKTDVTAFTVTAETAEAVIEVVPAGPNSGDREYTTERFLDFTAFPYRTLEWLALGELYDSGDTLNQLSNWQITGIQRGAPPLDWVSPRHGKLYVKYTHGATRRVYVYSDPSLSSGCLVLYGTLAGDGTLTLAEQNNSGLSGSVDVVGSASSSTITLNWKSAAQYRVRFDNKTGTIIESDVAVISDDVLLGYAATPFRYATDKLSAGTYKYRIDWADDAGNWQIGDVVQFAVDLAPSPVSDLSLSYSAATRKATLTWTDPTDADLDEMEVRQWESSDSPPIAATAVVAAGLETWESAVLSGPAVLFFRVNAKDSAGNVERSSVTLRLELDSAHEAVAERPNEVSSFLATPVADGKFRLVAVYDPAGEAAQATKVLFFHDSGTGTIDWNTVVASVALSAVGRMKRAVLAASGAFAHGTTIKWGARAATAADVADGSTSHVSESIADSEPIPGTLAVTVRLGKWESA
jgi:hypothetical protein